MIYDRLNQNLLSSISKKQKHNQGSVKAISHPQPGFITGILDLAGRKTSWSSGNVGKDEIQNVSTIQSNLKLQNNTDSPVQDFWGENFDIIYAFGLNSD